MDREVENNKDCKEAKYEIIVLLSESTVFDPLTTRRLKKFVRDGPFFVQAVTEVAIGENE